MSASQKLRESAGQAMNQNNLAAAAQMYESAEKMDRVAKDFRGVCASMNGRAGVYRYQNRFSESMALLEETEKVARELDDPQVLVDVLVNQAALLREIALTDKDAAKVKTALELVKKTEKLSRKHSLLGSLQFAFGTRSLLYRDLGKFDLAETAMKEQLQVARKIGKDDEVARCLTNLATLCFERGRKADAQTYIMEAEEIAQRLQLTMQLEYISNIRFLLDGIPDD